MAEPLTPERWIDSLREDHNGLVWVTKDELRQVFAARAAAPSGETISTTGHLAIDKPDAARAAAPSPDRAGLREALVDSMEAHEDGRRGGAYPHLGQTNDIRRFVDWIVDWMEKFTPSALLSEPPLDVERIVRLTVHTCRGRLLTAPADQEAAVKAALARLAEPEDARRGCAPNRAGLRERIEALPVEGCDDPDNGPIFVERSAVLALLSEPLLDVGRIERQARAALHSRGRDMKAADPPTLDAARAAAPLDDLIIARNAYANHMSGEADDCDGDESVLWCESCWRDALEWLDPTHEFGIDADIRARLSEEVRRG